MAHAAEFRRAVTETYQALTKSPLLTAYTRLYAAGAMAIEAGRHCALGASRSARGYDGLPEGRRRA